MSPVYPQEVGSGALPAWPISQPVFTTFLAHGTFEAREVAYLIDSTRGLHANVKARCAPPGWDSVSSWVGGPPDIPWTSFGVPPFFCSATYTTTAVSTVYSLGASIECCPS